MSNENAPARPVYSWQNRLHEIIFEADTPAGKAFDVSLIVIILLSVVVVILSTLESAQAEPFKSLYFILEWIFTAAFLVEYILRLMIVRRPLRYAFSFYGIIDLLSILPAFLGLFPNSSADKLMVIRTLRLLRIFRVFKLTRYLSEATALREAIKLSRHKLAVFMTAVLIVVLIASALMHVIESQAGNADFATLPGAMYWAVITMTTVGYGDIVPTTNLGKLITTALVLVGYSLIIIPTGILTAEIASTSKRVVTTRSCPSCMSEGHDLNATYCKNCGDSLES
jgi:voltage-gated potassium channel